MQIYIFMKNKKQHKHSRCLSMLKLKHDIKLLVYEHYQVKDMILKHDIKLLVYEHYQVKDMKLKHNIKLLVYEHYQVKDMKL